MRPAGSISLTEDISDENTVFETDAVLATHELADLFEKRGVDIPKLLENIEESGKYTFDNDITEYPRPASSSEHADNPYYSSSGQNQSSNGYSEYIFKKAAKDIFGMDIDSKVLEYKQCRNKDFNEVTLEIHGVTIMKFALAYGFRNIQNIIRNIKRKKCMYDYVELMACPGG